MSLIEKIKADREAGTRGQAEHLSRRAERAYRKTAAFQPVIPQEEIDRRAEARAMADDLRQTSILQAIEERIGISRTADASSGPWKYPTRKAKQPLCSGWWIMPAAAVCGAAWAGLFKWLGWW